MSVSGRALPGEAHNWLEYDEDHRGCPRCGLRVFRTPTMRGWTLVNFYGVPTSNLLADVSGGFGSCRPPPYTGDLVVLIDYTGDPDRFPGCERFMHRVREEQVPKHASADGGAQIVHLSSVLPACGYKPEFWELGPPRKHIGWTFCADCFPSEKIRSHRPRPEKDERKLPPAEKRLPPPPAPALRARPVLALPSGGVEKSDAGGFDDAPRRRRRKK
jgi:hypothetical protein